MQVKDLLLATTKRHGSLKEGGGYSTGVTLTTPSLK
jgi:hypothetical protein